MLSNIHNKAPQSSIIQPLRYAKFDKADQGLIEVNSVCNISCYGCYKQKGESNRSLEQIYSDIDALAKCRYPELVAIAGGEPTLYPYLEDVIRYCATKFRTVGMLTNGTTLTLDRLQQYGHCGLSCVLIHIDSTQKNRPDLDFLPSNEESLHPLRKHYASLCEQAGVAAIFTTTVYPNTLLELDQLMNFVMSLSRTTHGMINFAYSAGIDVQSVSPELVLTNRRIAEYLEQRMDLHPLFFLPSNKDDNKWCWLFYCVLISHDSKSQQILSLNPEDGIFGRSANMLMRLSHRHSSITYSPSFVTCCGILISYFLLCFSLARMRKIAAFAWRALKRRNLQFQFFVFQQPPNYTTLEDLEICHNCPDAVMRNGKLYPVCLVDKISPLSKPLPFTL